MALSVKLYRVVGKGKDRRYVAIDLERRGRRSKEDVTGPFYLRYPQVGTRGICGFWTTCCSVGQ
jgi:hypothetical protein